MNRAKKSILVLLGVLLIGLLAFSCSDGETGPTENQSPNAPTNPSPADKATGVSVTPTLTWECTDPDGDPLAYDVYFGTDSSSLAMASQEQTSASFTPVDTLDYDTTYYWYVVAEDFMENQSRGDVWAFTVAANQPPNAPSNPTPADGDTGITAYPTLSWKCSDPEGNPLTYDIYLGTDSGNLELIDEGWNSTSYKCNNLEPETVYYWQIVAKDGSNQTESDIWSFTTFTPVEIEWCEVPSGDYTYGPDDTVETIEYSYHIMKYEVTNWQYVQFLKEALAAGDISLKDGHHNSYSAWGWFDGDHPFYSPDDYEFFRRLDDGKWIDWTGSEFTIAPGKENYPVSNVTWFGAWAFANHHDGRLPSVYEWEKAARADTGYDYPWGDEIDGSRANYRDSGDPFEDEEHHNITPVGFYNGDDHDGFQTTDSPSPYGAYDMSGNVWEYTNTLSNIFNELFVSRGSSYADQTIYSWIKMDVDPNYDGDNVGFRCVREVE